MQSLIPSSYHSEVKIYTHAYRTLQLTAVFLRTNIFCGVTITELHLQVVDYFLFL